MKFLEKLLKTFGYLFSPSYRRKVDTELAWWKLFNACNHLLLKNAEIDHGDLEAARIINGKMRELNDYMRVSA